MKTRGGTLPRLSGMKDVGKTAHTICLSSMECEEHKNA